MPRTEIVRVQTAPKPSAWSRLTNAVRSYTIGPLTSRSPELARYFGGGQASAAGVPVNEHNIQNFSAVWSAVGLISDDISSLPLHFYKKKPSGPGRDKFVTHPLYWLLHDEPNPEMSSMVCRRTMTAHLMIWQNAYAEIERDRIGRPKYIWPLVPERVTPRRNALGEMEYVYQNDNGTNSTIPASDMIHLVGRSHDGSMGSSIVERAKESIGLALAAEKFGAAFFGNGATFGGVISYKGAKPPEMSDENYLESLRRKHQGVERAHKLLALYNDARYEETGTAPDSAQFLETRTFQIREVARWFKIPPHKLGDLADATFSNVEQMNTEYFISAIRPILVLWEGELNRKLVAPLERGIQFCKHSLEGFLRGDSAARAAFYTALFNLGAITPNEIREYEDMNPVAGGDESFVQINNVMPLSRINEYVEALIAQMEAKSEPAHPQNDTPSDPSSPDSEDSTAGAIQQMSAALLSMEARIAEQAESLKREVERAVTAEGLAKARTERVEVLEVVEGQLRETVREREARLAEMDAAHAAAMQEQVGKTAEQIAELHAQWLSERDGLVQSLDEARAEREFVAEKLHAAETSAAEATIAAKTLGDELAQMRAERDTMATDYQQAKAELLAAQAVAEEARKTAETHVHESRTARDAVAVAEDRAKREAEARELEALKVSQVESDNAVMAERLIAIGKAQRSLFVDAFERLLARESDRARKAQATPEKLRSWADGFYPLHADTCRSVLRPIVLAWAPTVGVNVDVVLDRIVREHIQRSERDVRLAADVSDPDELAANLATVLKRWETERADDVTDALMAEGERYGH